jgi:ubiquitin carboxyl-terminal hydrolase 9/24
MFPYTVEGLRVAENAGGGSEHIGIAASISSQYRLRGILVHMGTCDSGHYYSFIRTPGVSDGPDPQEQWFEFNDERITPRNFSDLDHHCFGGTEPFGGGKTTVEKNYNAYMAFYDRIEPTRRT